MRRSILISLMIIGAVSAMISGATFSAFTDSETATGSLTTGNVNVTLGSGGSLTWTPTTSTCAPNMGSTAVCKSDVTVNYAGNLAAELDLDLVYTDAASCFAVTLAWNGGTAATGASPLHVDVATAASGTANVTVSVKTGLTQSQLNACQDKTVSLTLTVTATEKTGA